MVISNENNSSSNGNNGSNSSSCSRSNSTYHKSSTTTTTTSGNLKNLQSLLIVSSCILLFHTQSMNHDNNSNKSHYSPYYHTHAFSINQPQIRSTISNIHNKLQYRSQALFATIPDQQRQHQQQRPPPRSTSHSLSEESNSWWSSKDNNEHTASHYSSSPPQSPLSSYNLNNGQYNTNTAYSSGKKQTPNGGRDVNGGSGSTDGANNNRNTSMSPSASSSVVDNYDSTKATNTGLRGINTVIMNANDAYDHEDDDYDQSQFTELRNEEFQSSFPSSTTPITTSTTTSTAMPIPNHPQIYQSTRLASTRTSSSSLSSSSTTTSSSTISSTTTSSSSTISSMGQIQYNAEQKVEGTVEKQVELSVELAVEKAINAQYVASHQNRLDVGVVVGDGSTNVDIVDNDSVKNGNKNESKNVKALNLATGYDIHGVQKPIKEKKVSPMNSSSETVVQPVVKPIVQPVPSIQPQEAVNLASGHDMNGVQKKKLVKTNDYLSSIQVPKETTTLQSQETSPNNTKPVTSTTILTNNNDKTTSPSPPSKSSSSSPEKRNDILSSRVKPDVNSIISTPLMTQDLLTREYTKSLKHMTTKQIQKVEPPSFPEDFERRKDYDRYSRFVNLGSVGGGYDLSKRKEIVSSRNGSDDQQQNEEQQKQPPSLEESIHSVTADNTPIEEKIHKERTKEREMEYKVETDVQKQVEGDVEPKVEMGSQGVVLSMVEDVVETTGIQGKDDDVVGSTVLQGISNSTTTITDTTLDVDSVNNDIQLDNDDDDDDDDDEVDFASIAIPSDSTTTIPSMEQTNEPIIQKVKEEEPNVVAMYADVFKKDVSPLQLKLEKEVISNSITTMKIFVDHNTSRRRSLLGGNVMTSTGVDSNGYSQNGTGGGVGVNVIGGVSVIQSIEAEPLSVEIDEFDVIDDDDDFYAKISHTEPLYTFDRKETSNTDRINLVNPLDGISQIRRMSSDENRTPSSRRILNVGPNDNVNANTVMPKKPVVKNNDDVVIPSANTAKPLELNQVHRMVVPSNKNQVASTKKSKLQIDPETIKWDNSAFGSSNSSSSSSSSKDGLDTVRPREGSNHIHRRVVPPNQGSKVDLKPVAVDWDETTSVRRTKRRRKVELKPVAVNWDESKSSSSTSSTSGSISDNSSVSPKKESKVELKPVSVSWDDDSSRSSSNTEPTSVDKVEKDIKDRLKTFNGLDQISQIERTVDTSLSTSRKVEMVNTNRRRVDPATIKFESNVGVKNVIPKVDVTNGSKVVQEPTKKEDVAKEPIVVDTFMNESIYNDKVNEYQAAVPGMKRNESPIQAKSEGIALKSGLNGRIEKPTKGEIPKPEEITFKSRLNEMTEQPNRVEIPSQPNAEKVASESRLNEMTEQINRVGIPSQANTEKIASKSRLNGRNEQPNRVDIPSQPKPEETSFKSTVNVMTEQPKKGGISSQPTAEEILSNSRLNGRTVQPNTNVQKRNRHVRAVSWDANGRQKEDIMGTSESFKDFAKMKERESTAFKPPIKDEAEVANLDQYKLIQPPNESMREVRVDSNDNNLAKEAKWNAEDQSSTTAESTYQGNKPADTVRSRTRITQEDNINSSQAISKDPVKFAAGMNRRKVTNPMDDIKNIRDTRSSRTSYDGQERRVDKAQSTSNSFAKKVSNRDFIGSQSAGETMNPGQSQPLPKVVNDKSSNAKQPSASANPRKQTLDKYLMTVTRSEEVLNAKKKRMDTTVVDATSVRGKVESRNSLVRTNKGINPRLSIPKPVEMISTKSELFVKSSKKIVPSKQKSLYKDETRRQNSLSEEDNKVYSNFNSKPEKSSVQTDRTSSKTSQDSNVNLPFFAVATNEAQRSDVARKEGLNNTEKVSAQDNVLRDRNESKVDRIAALEKESEMKMNELKKSKASDSATNLINQPSEEAEMNQQEGGQSVGNNLDALKFCQQLAMDAEKKIADFMRGKAEASEVVAALQKKADAETSPKELRKGAQVKKEMKESRPTVPPPKAVQDMSQTSLAKDKKEEDNILKDVVSEFDSTMELFKEIDDKSKQLKDAVFNEERALDEPDKMLESVLQEYDSAIQFCNEIEVENRQAEIPVEEEKKQSGNTDEMLEEALAAYEDAIKEVGDLKPSKSSGSFGIKKNPIEDSAMKLIQGLGWTKNYKDEKPSNGSSTPYSNGKNVRSKNESKNSAVGIPAGTEKSNTSRLLPLSELKVGSVIEGHVSSFTNYGAFIKVNYDLRGDGSQGLALLHKTQVHDGSVNKLSTLFREGERIEGLRVMEINYEKGEVSLSLRSSKTREKVVPEKVVPGKVPMKDIPIGRTLAGIVSNVVSYGAFIDIGAVVKPLVHVSKMSRHDRVEDAKEYLKKGDKVNVKIIAKNASKKTMEASMLDEDPNDHLERLISRRENESKHPWARESYEQSDDFEIANVVSDDFDFLTKDTVDIDNNGASSNRNEDEVYKQGEKVSSIIARKLNEFIQQQQEKFVVKTNGQTQ